MEAKINDFVNSGSTKFLTSGTMGNSKVIEKTFENLQKECKDIFEALRIPQNLVFTTTTVPEHLFGFTFFAMLPYFYGYKRQLARINYPEDIKAENAVLITTPSFLEAMRKYESKPIVNPKIIITAGAELKKDTFLYAQSISERVIEIYGSTETGVIGFRENPENKFQKFSGIEILKTTEDFTQLETQYSKDSIVEISDRISFLNNQISFMGRSGRILKILEKRISANDLEAAIKQNSLIKDAYCFEYNNKIAALIVLEKAGIDFVIKNGKFELTKMLKNSLASKFEILPHKWRLWYEIPTDIRGKVDKNLIKELFDLNLALPLITNSLMDGENASIEMVFLKNSNFFKGHFEELPILAGVVQLFYANFFSKLIFDIDCRCGQLRKIKFSNIIRPNKEVYLHLKKTNLGISYKFENETVFSTGLLPLENTLS